SFRHREPLSSLCRSRSRPTGIYADIQNHPQCPYGVIGRRWAAFLAKALRPLGAIVPADDPDVLFRYARPRPQQGSDPFLSLIFRPRFELHVDFEAFLEDSYGFGKRHFAARCARPVLDFSPFLLIEIRQS